MKHRMSAAAALLCAALLLAALPIGIGRAEAPADADSAAFDSYFDDAVFCGDSLTVQLQYFVKTMRSEQPDFLGGARFLCTISYPLSKAASKSAGASDVALRYRGTAVSVPDGLNWMGAGKVFLFFGLNDACADLDRDMERYGRMIDNIREKNPGIVIIAQSLTPVKKGHTNYRLNPENLNAFNARLEALCAEKGAIYLDIATPLKDEEGYLNQSLELRRDDNVHLGTEGVRIWVGTLRAFAASQMTAGAEGEAQALTDP